MLKKTMTYDGFDGEKYTDDFYFNLTKAEALELEVSAEGNSLSDYIKKIAATKNGAEIIKYFKIIILSAYGEKSVDGKRFIKNQELRDSFEQTTAFSDLFMELATNAGAAAVFVNAIVPADMQQEIQKIQQEAARTAPTPAPVEGKTAAQIARERSEAALRGHQKPVTRNPNAEQPVDPEKGVLITKTAEPVLEETDKGDPDEKAPDFSEEEIARFREFLSKQP